ncbi:hypothetical protein QMA10_10970 [Arthrobacter sp. APC 3897]|uniref:hypothetical protein n=1 Tax=Arthrobacter sp. APC 3897 TaxID=3035204 RepID=UPI0025B2F889|nr:hypothetical protein [Arthrobacter sp. APC 3897]MDN3482443.1 hypothetical protein [Arthrobacter sp. APC 3897]
MIMGVFVMAWALGLWSLLKNTIEVRGYVPPSWWWTTLPFSVVGFITAVSTKSPFAGIAVGLVAAVAVHLWASAKYRKKHLRAEELPSYVGRHGVVTEAITSLDYGRLNLEGTVEIEDGRTVYAITRGLAEKEALPKGSLVRIVGTTPGDWAVVEPVGEFNDGYLMR